MTTFALLNSRHHSGIKQFFAALITILFAQPISADTNHTIEQITELTRQTLDQKAKQSSLLLNAQRTEISVTPPPKNLRLTPCDTPPEITLMTESHAGSQRLQLRCQSPNSWTIHMRGSIDVYVNVLVSSTPMNRGTKPGKKNIVFGERNISNLKRGYLLNYKQLENMTTARRIRAGEVIIPSMLEPEQIIQRGDRVNLIAGSGSLGSDSGNFHISTPGEAMNNGALHQQIRVKNIGSGRIVRGTVISKSEVRVE